MVGAAAGLAEEVLAKPSFRKNLSQKPLLTNVLYFRRSRSQYYVLYVCINCTLALACLRDWLVSW